RQSGRSLLPASGVALCLCPRVGFPRAAAPVQTAAATSSPASTRPDVAGFARGMTVQMGQNPIRNPTNPFPPYKSSPPNPIQPSTLIIQTTPNHCIISSQTKLNCLTVHG